MQSVISPGTKVTYHNFPSDPERGIVKSVNGNSVFVVFNCGGNWDEYQNYIGVSCPRHRLSIGWPEDHPKLPNLEKYII